MNQQLVQPNLGVQDGTGWCLRFTQSVWGAPARYKSAWDAWQATTLKHDKTEALPSDVSVICWMEHWGSYGEVVTSWGNWGHVVTYVPGRGFLSSPARGVGQLWLGTMAEVERTFNAKYVGWSEDINGRRVAKIDNTPQPKDEDMAQGAFYRAPTGKIVWQEKPNTVLIPLELVTWVAYAANGNKYADISQKDFDALLKKYGTAPVPPAGSSGGTVNVPDFKITMSGEAVKK